jgi:hypothetical protein
VTVERTTAQKFALTFGVVYVLIGLLGFVVTGFDNFAGKTFEDELLVFPVNPLHNVVHIALGAIWLGGAGRPDLARQVNVLMGVALGLVTILGALGVLEFLAIDSFGSPDNFLHLVSAALSLYFGTAGAEAAEGAITG